MLSSQPSLKTICLNNSVHNTTVKLDGTLLTCAQTEKVFACLGTNIRKQLKDYTPNCETNKKKNISMIQLEAWKTSGMLNGDTRHHRSKFCVTKKQVTMGGKINRPRVQLRCYYHTF